MPPQNDEPLTGWALAWTWIGLLFASACLVVAVLAGIGALVAALLY